MRYPASITICLFVVSALLLAPRRGFADDQDKVEQFVQQLRENADFRVRTQAALALGASNDQRAVQPLCDGLGDENTTVRAAAAAAMGKLLLGGQECLERRLDEETNTAVRSVIQQAIERLRNGGGAPGPSLDVAKYYVGIGPVTNKTSRSNDDVNRVMRTALINALYQLSDYATAPVAETPDQARGVLAKYKQLKPFFIWPKVEVVYADGSLTVKVDLSLFTYPGKAFKGSMSRNLTMPDTPSPDTSAEDELMRTAAENLVPELAKLADQL